MIRKTPVEIPNQPSPREKRKKILHAIGGGWYINKLGQKLPPLKKRRLSKKSQKEEDEIKRELTEANHYWSDWKFQIHWNKIEWLNPRSHNEQNGFFCSL